MPAGGFAALRGFNGAPHPFTLALVASDGDGRLPRASTCFNTLYLPAYFSAEVLRQRLLTAVSGSHIFDEGGLVLHFSIQHGAWSPVPLSQAQDLLPLRCYLHTPGMVTGG